MQAQLFPDGDLGTVALAPGAVTTHMIRNIFNGGIKHDTIAARARERRICQQFGEHMVVGVIGVKADQNALIAIGDFLHLRDDLEGDGGLLDHRDAFEHGVSLDGLPVVSADADVYSQNIGIMRAITAGEIAVTQSPAVPFFLIIVSSRKAGAPGFLMPRPQSETRFCETFR